MQALQDFFSRHTIVLSTLFFVVVGGYLAVLEFWYFGNIHFFLSEKNTTIRIEGNGELMCPENFCTATLIPGTYSYSVEKENFSSFFGEVEVNMQENSEEKIQLTPASVQISTEKNTRFVQKNRVIEFSDPEISGENIFPEVLKYFSAQKDKNIQISTDEVGRGYWAVTPQKVKLFMAREKNISTHFFSSTDRITQFMPLQDGSFFLKTQSGKFFWNNRLFSHVPLVFSALCKSGDEFVFLEENAGEIQLSSQKFLNDTSEFSAKKWLGGLENFDRANFHSLQCFASNTVVIFLKTGENVVMKY